MKVEIPKVAKVSVLGIGESSHWYRSGKKSGIPNLMLMTEPKKKKNMTLEWKDFQPQKYDRMYKTLIHCAIFVAYILIKTSKSVLYECKCPVIGWLAGNQFLPEVRWNRLLLLWERISAKKKRKKVDTCLPSNTVPFCVCITKEPKRKKNNDSNDPIRILWTLTELHPKQQDTKWQRAAVIMPKWSLEIPTWSVEGPFCWHMKRKLIYSQRNVFFPHSNSCLCLWVSLCRRLASRWVPWWVREGRLRAPRPTCESTCMQTIHLKQSSQQYAAKLTEESCHRFNWDLMKLCWIGRFIFALIAIIHHSSNGKLPVLHFYENIQLTPLPPPPKYVWTSWYAKC